jgi:hypothetical protein
MSISVASYASPDSGSAFVHPVRDASDAASSTEVSVTSAAAIGASAALPSMPRALWTLLLCTATYLVRRAKGRGESKCPHSHAPARTLHFTRGKKI